MNEPQTTMTDEDFSRFMERVGELFPRHELTPEQVRLWKRNLRQYPLAWVTSAIEAMYANQTGVSKRTPPLGELTKRCESKRVSRDGRADSWRGNEREREALEQQLATDRARVLALDPSEREAHKVTVLEHEPRMAWAAVKPTDGRTWVAVIAQRLRYGLGPDEYVDLTAKDSAA